MFGYLACKELEHGLSTASLSPEGTPCTFKSASSVREGHGVWMPPSRSGSPAGCDLSYLVDLAPVTINIHSSIVLVHEVHISRQCEVGLTHNCWTLADVHQARRALPRRCGRARTLPRRNREEQVRALDLTPQAPAHAFSRRYLKYLSFVERTNHATAPANPPV